MSTPTHIGKYRVEGVLGQGGMGTVYRAFDVAIHRQVAIKTIVLPPGTPGDEAQETSQRFLREAQAAGKSVDLALAIVRKLHPALVERQGLAEIESVLSQCLESLKQEPRLVTYVHSARLDALQERLAQLSTSTGFEGRVVLIGDDAMGESDCRVEWADGGVEREAGRIWRAVEEALNRYLAADGREAK